jgi:hypothetical protein
MPYVSKAERERAEWVKLPALVTQVQEADACDAKAARKQIRAMLADGVLWPLRWENPLSAPWSILPARGGKGWLTAKINWKTGKVLDTDNDGLTAEGRAVWAPKRRMLLIHCIPVRDLVRRLHAQTVDDAISRAP